MNTIDAAAHLRDMRDVVLSRTCLGLPELRVGKMYLATVYGHKGCGFRVLRKSAKARVVMAENVMDPEAPPIRLPKAHIERTFYGEHHRGYHCFSEAELRRCNELAALV